MSLRPVVRPCRCRSVSLDVLSGASIYGGLRMSMPCKFERSILSYEEQEIILPSHHPEIYDAGLDELVAPAPARYAQ